MPSELVSGLRSPVAGDGGPADPRVALALEALRGARERFDSAVADAAERLRALIEAQRAPRNGKAASAGAELGAFADDRIDFDRFASTFSNADTLPPATLARIEAARDVLAGLIRDGVAPHRLRLESGEDLRMEVGYTLARAGRAFGAARAASRARSGTGSLADEAMIAAFPFRRWNAAEKAIAPPLLVELEGGDLRADGLGDFLEGAFKLCLLVRGEAPAAALAEVVSPGVFVAQRRLPVPGSRSPDTETEAAGGPDAGADLLRRFAAFEGPGVVALFESECAEFVHDPSAPAGRKLVVSSMPEPAERAIGWVSAARQREALGLLRVLERGLTGTVTTHVAGVVEEAVEAKGAVGVSESSSASSPATQQADVTPADLLAAWLLRQAEIPEPAITSDNP